MQSCCSAAAAVHEHEVFGPVATLIPYDGTAADAAVLVCKGEGGLVASIYSDDQRFIREALFGIAPYHGGPARRRASAPKPLKPLVRSSPPPAQPARFHQNRAWSKKFGPIPALSFQDTGF